MAHGDTIVFYMATAAIIKDRYGNADWGNIPCVNYNAITKQFEPVVNTRGNAYAYRNAQRYRKRSKSC